MALDSILLSLGLDGSEIRTYVTLLREGPIPAGKLAKKLGVARPSLYGFLRRLQSRGIVSESLRRGVKVFAAEPPEQINRLFSQRIEQLEQNQNQFRELLPTIKKQMRTAVVQPRVHMYEGTEGLQSVLKDMLLYSDLKTAAVWPIRSMVDVLSPDFFRYLNRERIRNNLYTRAIWPKNEMVDIARHPYLGIGKGFLREIRIAPDSVDCSLGYWIYGPKVAFISSRRESIGFVIESEELAQTLLTQFEIVWNASAPLQVDKTVTQKFLDELKRYP